ISDSLPAIGVMTAPAIRYEERIHDDVLYEILKSRIKSGIAGSTIVSPYIVIRPRQLSIANVVHAERLMLVCFSTPVITLPTPSIFWDYLRNSRRREYSDKSTHCKETRGFPYVDVCIFNGSRCTHLT